MPALDFKGKTFVQDHHLAVKCHQLIPREDKSRGGDFSLRDNLIIHGDNLKALKALLPAYAGKIKCIYIDPPYNTGNAGWVYNDNLKSPRLREWLGETVDTEGMDRHDKWLCMMMPRLKLLRELLRDDGVIFVSIDDNEQHRLRMLLDEVFDEVNFFAQIIVRANSRGQTYNQIPKTHEYLLIYTKTPEAELSELEKAGVSDDLHLKDEIGAFNIRELRNRNPKFGRHNRPNLFYPIYVDPAPEDKDGFCRVSLAQSSAFSVEVKPFNSKGKESCWRWGEIKFNENVTARTLTSSLVAKRKRNGSFGIYEKYRKTTYKPKSIWDDNSMLNETGTIELKELGLEDLFEFPKPVALVKRCIELATKKGDIVLDSFAGAGTTAHAVLELNRSGRGLKFILVEQEDFADTVTAERVRRVMDKFDREDPAADRTFSYFELGDPI